MTLLTKVSVSLIILLLSFAVLWNVTSPEQPVDEVNPAEHALKIAINTCDGITERAASDLVAVVEFQKLEIVGRKARVFKMCMNDRGYTENEEWLEFSKAVAEKTAKETNISLGEATENLRRANMKDAVASDGWPDYWVMRQNISP